MVAEVRTRIPRMARTRVVPALAIPAAAPTTVAKDSDNSKVYSALLKCIVYSVKCIVSSECIVASARLVAFRLKIFQLPTINLKTDFRL